MGIESELRYISRFTATNALAANTSSSVVALHPPGPARAGELIRIRGARTHNLKNINLDLPRNRLIVITGLSNGAYIWLRSRSDRWLR